ncbi:DUF3313 domain-containing protein [Vibrio sp. SS-MA-C1-2]|uniref:DUF3313 family protein n=1 Tax=Vibrio sp. SS-MA-C1-2 TaxID=2908646 RepID=UPI001F25F897|nr:DUF3313 family protein [Vibrio sp. SS-MA-C1-2]UJF17179.1 DUF3313 domain-containing protein [Vibrio sp. SS-MA-C1-2]
MPTKDEMAMVDKQDLQLQPMNYDKGNHGLEWISPAAKHNQYEKLMIAPVILDSANIQTNRIPDNVLLELTNQVNLSLTAQVESTTMPVVQKKGQDVAKLVVTIAKANTHGENMKPTEIIPVGALIGLVGEAAGFRDESVRLFAVLKLVDSETDQLIAERVAVYNGNGVLDNNHSVLTLKDLKKKDNQRAANDGYAFIKHVATELNN